MRTIYHWWLLLGLVPAGACVAAYGQVTPEPCYVDGSSRQVLCGELAVPLAKNSSEKIELAYILVQANAERRSEDAILVLAGGPGQGARDFAGGLDVLLDAATRQRDLLFIDVRGTGGSAPLNCPDMNWVGQDSGTMIRHLRECRRGLSFEPAHFTSMQYISDLERVREAFGYQQWNLLGGSYGTRLGQLYMREHPEVIRSAVLDSIAPLDEVIGARMGADADAALQGVFRRCESDAACQAAFPDVRQDFFHTLENLKQAPVAVRFRHPRSSEWQEQEVGFEDVTALLRVLLYSRDQHRVLPWLLDQAAKGNFEPFMTTAVTMGEGMIDAMAVGLTANILCSEDIGRHGHKAVPGAEAASFLGTLQSDFWLAVCEDWPRYPVSAEYDQPLESAVPTLLISGELDPVTPPANGVQLLATLSNARHVVLPGGGHTDAFRGGYCITRMVNQFINNPDPQALDVDCVENLGPRPFFTRSTGFSMAEQGEEQTDD